MVRVFQAFGPTIVAFVLLATVALRAQTPLATPQASPTPESTVEVFFTVTDNHEKLVQGLAQEEFTVLDNAKPPARVVSFENSTAGPMRLGLLVDASNSMRYVLPDVQSVLGPLIGQMIRPASDKALVVGFDEVVEVLQDLTGDTDKLGAAIRRIHAGGSSSVWDSVYFVARDVLMKEEASGSVQRVILLVTDGDDNHSHVNEEEAIQMAQTARVTIYCITPTPNDRQSIETMKFRVLSSATGGRTFLVASAAEMRRALTEITEELRSRYHMVYVPDNPSRDEKFRAIKIKVADSKLKVRAAKGYFAPASAR